MLLACLFVLLFACPSPSQTACAKQHTATGAFVCYPNPSVEAKDTIAGHWFHLSAQGNAPPGRPITAYKVWLDDRLIGDVQLGTPSERLSLETNLESPFDLGSHALRIEMEAAGSAVVKNLQFFPAKAPAFCDRFSRFDPRSCTLLAHRDSLQWNSPTGASPGAYMELYSSNLKALELDTADAMAVDGKGSLYVASHAFSDVDLRKYAPDGSLIYSSLLRSCGEGFLSVVALNVDDAGHVWIAGNTNACISTTSYAPELEKEHHGKMRGFVALIDTTIPGSSPPVYETYLADSPYQISGLFVDQSKNVYVAGNADSVAFPHEGSVSIDAASPQNKLTRQGFAAALNTSGSGFRWSTLLPNLETTAITADESGNVYLAGRAGPRPVVARLSEAGRLLSYSTNVDAFQNGDPRAIALSGGRILVAGLAANGPLAVELQLCKSAPVRSLQRSFYGADESFPDVVFAPALSAFGNRQTGPTNACPEDPIR